MGIFVRSFVVLLGCTAVACGPSDGIGGGGGDDGGGGGTIDSGSGPGQPDARRGSGFIDSGGPTEFVDAMADANCGVQQEDIEVVNNGAPPDLLVVLDRSRSMDNTVPFDPMWRNRWQVMRDVLTQITSTHDDAIRFGVSVFPTDDSCGVAPGTAVPVADTNAAAIASWYDTVLPEGGGTPAQFALAEALVTYNSMPVNPDGRYVLYATDGKPNCDSDGPDADGAAIAAIEALRGQGINTFVIGFGFVFPEGHLNDAANAGGTPRPAGSTDGYFYYNATSAADLEAALEEIAGGIVQVSCEYELTELPPDPDAVTVSIDGVPVPKSTSHTNGWDYAPDNSHITFFGTYCELIQSGSSGSVKFSYGCPGVVVD